jgi:hypothetical protein
MEEMEAAMGAMGEATAETVVVKAEMAAVMMVVGLHR